MYFLINLTITSCCVVFYQSVNIANIKYCDNLFFRECNLKAKIA